MISGQSIGRLLLVTGFIFCSALQGAAYNAQESQNLIFRAAANGNIAALASCKQKNIPLNKPNDKGEIALMIAAYNGHHEAVEFLAQENPNDVNSRTLLGETAAHFAVRGRRDKVLHVLHRHNADLDIPCKKKRHTPIMRAVVQDDIEMVDLLSRLGVSMRMPDGSAKVDIYGNTCIHLAALEGKVNMINHLHSQYHFLLVEIADGGLTPLMVAAFAGKSNVVEFLADADPELLCTVSDAGYTAPHLAAMNGESDVLRMLHKRGVDLNSPAHNPSKQTPYMCARERKQADAMKTLVELLGEEAIKRGEWADAQEEKLTAKRKQAQLAGAQEEKLILKKKQAQEKQTLYQQCSQGDHLGVSTLLAEMDQAKRGPFINTDFSALSKGQDKSPLSVAIKGKHGELVRLLLQEGAQCGPLEIDLALQQGDGEILEALIPYAPTIGAILPKVMDYDEKVMRALLKKNKEMVLGYRDTNTRDTLGHLAAQKGNVSVLKCLLDAGIDVTIKNKRIAGKGGLTIADVAEIAKKESRPHSAQIVKLLRGGQQVLKSRNADEIKPIIDEPKKNKKKKKGTPEGLAQYQREQERAVAKRLRMEQGEKKKKQEDEERLRVEHERQQQLQTKQQEKVAAEQQSEWDHEQGLAEALALIKKEKDIEALRKKEKDIEALRMKRDNYIQALLIKREKAEQQEQSDWERGCAVQKQKKKALEVNVRSFVGDAMQEAFKRANLLEEDRVKQMQIQKERALLNNKLTFSAQAPLFVPGGLFKESELYDMATGHRTKAGLAALKKQGIKMPPALNRVLPVQSNVSKSTALTLAKQSV